MLAGCKFVSFLLKKQAPLLKLVRLYTPPPQKKSKRRNDTFLSKFYDFKDARHVMSNVCLLNENRNIIYKKLQNDKKAKYSLSISRVF